MCGIYGFIPKVEREFVDLSSKRFTDFISCNQRLLETRGPDDQGTEITPEGCILGHTRLSILDKTERGKQPMRYRKKVVTYNGEIYNYKSLIKRLKSVNKKPLSTETDTEVLLRGLDELGVDILPSLNGMYAFCLWDQEAKKGYLHRDPAGTKPLFYYQDNLGIFFSSDVRALLKILPTKPSINYQALSQYLYFTGITGSLTFYDQIYQLEPGELIEVSANSVSHTILKWPSKCLESENRSLKNMLEGAVDRCLISHRPIGVLLSSGVDSSLVASIASRRYDASKIQSYTALYKNEEGGANEWYEAGKISEYLGISHNIVEIKHQSILEDIDDVLAAYHQPFGDLASIPMLKLYKEISKESVVILQGDGGDEFFSGYPRYRLEKYYKNKIARSRYFQVLVDGLASRYGVGYSISKSAWRMAAPNKAFFHANTLAQISRSSLLRHSISKTALSTVMGCDPYAYYRSRQFEDIHKKANGYLIEGDQLIHLRNIYTAKVDRASMHYSCEARMPFLDRTLISSLAAFEDIGLSFRSPNKARLRLLLKSYLPSNLIKNKKSGFGYPYHRFWESGEMSQIKDYVGSRINRSSIINCKEFLRLLSLIERPDSVEGLEVYKVLQLLRWEELYL